MDTEGLQYVILQISKCPDEHLSPSVKRKLQYDTGIIPFLFGFLELTVDFLFNATSPTTHGTPT